MRARLQVAQQTTQPSPTRTDDRYDELDAYRGFAALFIVIFHAYANTGIIAQPYQGTAFGTLLNTLWITVGWFFTLSGFVIFLPFARAALGKRRVPSLRDYAIRRLLRLVPLYLVVFFLTWPMVAADSATWTWPVVLANVTLTQGFWPSFPSVVPQSWTLSIEIVFYFFIALFGPLVCAATLRLQAMKARIALLAGLLALLALFAQALRFGLSFGSDSGFDPAAPFLHFDSFILGMGIAVAIAAADGRPLLPRWSIGALRLTGVALWGLYFVLPNIGVAQHYYVYFPASLGFALILASTLLVPRGTGWQRWLSSPLPTWLGLISYGLYMWHPLIQRLMAGVWEILGIPSTPGTFPFYVVASTVVVFVISAIAYRYIEQPALKLRHRFAGQRTPTREPEPAVPTMRGASLTET